MSAEPISFFVHGIPKPQPRPRAFARKMGNGKFSARVYDAGTAEAWKSDIAVAARSACPDRVAIAGPIYLALAFTMPRPRWQYRTGKRSDELRDDAPRWHSGKPDCDNLAKAVMDALTQLGGFWHDDSQVAMLFVTKHFLQPTGATGCMITIEPIKTKD